MKINTSRNLTRVMPILLCLLILLILSEVYLRYFVYRPLNRTWDCYQPDLNMYVSYRPFSSCAYRRYHEFDLTTHINNVGQRSDFMTTLEKPTGVKRILVLGDSYVAGHEVEERQTFVKQLENIFRKNNHFVEVLNGGIRGYSPFLDIFYLKFHGLKFDPDVVVLVINTGDFAEDQRYQPYKKKDPISGKTVSVYPNWSFYYERVIATASSTRSADKTLPKKINIVQAISQRVPNLEVIRVIQQMLNSSFNYFLGIEFIATTFRPGDFRTDPFAIERDVIVNNTREKMFVDTQSNVLTIAQMVRVQGKQFYLVILPAGHEVSPIEWSIGRKSLGFAENKIYQPQALKKMSQWANKSDIDVIDLTPILSIPHDEEYYLPFDGHLSVAGHIKVAKRIAQELLPIFQ